MMAKEIYKPRNVTSLQGQSENFTSVFHLCSELITKNFLSLGTWTSGPLYAIRSPKLRLSGKTIGPKMVPLRLKLTRTRKVFMF